MNIEIVMGTAIFARHETKTVEYIATHEFRGYGHEFEKAYTTQQTNGSTGHHRVIAYRFGGLRFLVRYETDAYVGSTTNSSPHKPEVLSSDKTKTHTPDKIEIPCPDTTSISSPGKSETASAAPKPSTHGDLSGLLEELSLTGSSNPTKPALQTTRLTIKHDGKAVSTDSILEIKTRVQHKPIELKEVAPQLWISQTPNLVRAYHQRGEFSTVTVEHIAAVIKEWETSKQVQLSIFAALLKKIITLVERCGGKATLRYSAKLDVLSISKTDFKDMLPEDLYLKWTRKDDVQGDAKAKAETKQEDDRGENVVLRKTDTDDDSSSKAQADEEPKDKLIASAKSKACNEASSEVTNSALQNPA